MFVLNCIIKIANYTFKQVHSVRIVKSVDLLSDTALVKLPASALFGNADAGFTKQQLENTITAGMPIQIILSYKGVFTHTEFKGFVTFVNPNSPIVSIEAEDAMYTIRQKHINKNFGTTTLRNILQYITLGTGLYVSGNIPKINFNRFIIKNKNGAQALQKLAEAYGLNIYINEEGNLYAGLQQTQTETKQVHYNLHKNVVKHQLKYRKAEDVKLYVKVIGVQNDNTKIEVIVGETNGEQRTLHKYNIASKATLKAIGEAELSELKYTGYRGTIKSFLVPFATRGMQAVITDNNYPNRGGTYFIPKVTTTFGQSGARRIVELGNKLN